MIPSVVRGMFLCRALPQKADTASPIMKADEGGAAGVLQRLWFKRLGYGRREALA